MPDGWLPAPPAWAERAWHCHRRPDRCLAVRGRPMWVCARCLGGMAGTAAGLAAVAASALLGLPAAPWLLAGAAAGAWAGAMDWLVQETLGVESTNARRLAAGAFLGFASVLLPWALLRQALG